jgi:hypothetical protein
MGMGLTSSYKPQRIVQGQVAPDNVEAPVTQAPATQQPEENLEEQPEEDVADNKEPKAKTNDVIGDDNIEEALSGVTLKQATMKAEYIAQLYKSRLISRELQILDLYLQALDIDMYFNQELSEALNKALDSNQYGLTRIENILAKLRGASSENISIEQIRNKFNQKVLEQDYERQQKVLGDDEEEKPVADEAAKAPGTAPNKTPAAPAATVETPPATNVEPEELSAKPQVEQPKPGVRV